MEGARLQKRFLQSLPALARFKALVDAQVTKYGLLPGLDGRSLHIRSEHKALNALLQSAGAVVMKKALILLDRHLRIEGWVKNKDYAFVANIHDEFQAEVVPDRAERFGQLAVLVDMNGLQALGATDHILRTTGFSGACSSLGWTVIEVDGHDVRAIRNALNTAGSKHPLLLVCETTGGKGVSFMEGKFEWHYLPMDADQFQRALTEVENA